MGIDRYAVADSESGPEHDGSGLSADPGQCEQFAHGFWNRSVKIAQENLADPMNELRLVAIRSAGANFSLELRPRKSKILSRRSHVSEKVASDSVDDRIGALSAEHGRNEQIERCSPFQKRSRRRMEFFERIKHLYGRQSFSHAKMVRPTAIVAKKIAKNRRRKKVKQTRWKFGGETV